MGHIGAGQPCTADFNTVNVNSSANLRSFVRQLEITLSAKHTHAHTHTYSTDCSTRGVREYVFYVFLRFQKTRLLTFFLNDLMEKSRKKSLAKVESSILRNDFTHIAQ